MWQGKTNDNRQAFTLIEMMVVVALIGILIAGVFRLLGAAGQSNKRAKTMERLQRLENALSGFYAEYGSYPPVPRQGSANPYESQDSRGRTTAVSSLEADNAERACRSQPVAFEFPSPKGMDDYILGNFGLYSANVNVGAFDKDSDNWADCKLFRYGVMSFLLPRLEAMGFHELSEPGSSFSFSGNSGEKVGEKQFFSKERKQWSNHNEGYSEDIETLEKQYEREMKSCSRWMPNYEKMVAGGRVFNGIQTKGDPTSGKRGAEGLSGTEDKFVYSQSSGNKYVLGCMTIVDGWENEIFYYSAAPYQSYRIWSAGPDGKTFPPWIPLESLSASDRKTVSAWVQDDIARFDH